MKVKNHVFTHGNINDNQLDIAIAENYPNGIDFCYTDPPWGNGNLNYWDTMNKKMNQQTTDQIDQITLENRVVHLICKHVKNYAFIVYGVREAESLISILNKQPNVTDVQYIEKKYKSGDKWLKNCVIAVTLNSAAKRDWFPILENKNGLEGLHAICQEFKNIYTSCLECFVGQGFYLKVFDKYGFNVIGNELNLSRLQKAISKIT